MYGKIFSTLYEGTMVGAGPTVFAVWGYCIAKAETDGFVLLNPSLLAAIIGTTSAEIENAIKFLQEPDETSKNTEYEGKRLVHQSGYLYIVASYGLYCGIKTNEDRREYMKKYMQEYRKKENVNGLQSLQELTAEDVKVNPLSTSTSTSVSKSKKGECEGGKADDYHKALGELEAKPASLAAAINALRAGNKAFTRVDDQMLTNILHSQPDPAKRAKAIRDMFVVYAGVEEFPRPGGTLRNWMQGKPRKKGELSAADESAVDAYSKQYRVLKSKRHGPQSEEIEDKIKRLFAKVRDTLGPDAVKRLKAM